MGFKFFNNNEEDLDGPMELVFNDPQNITHHFNVQTGDINTTVYLRDIRDRNLIPEDEWYDILRTQRNRLIEEIWRNGNIIHEIISQDENGYTLQTRIII